MSATEMGVQAPRRAAELIDEAVGELHAAQREIKDLQGKISDSWLWHRLEAIDDKIHNALAKLGD